MALDDEQKRTVLQQMVDSAEMDIFRQEAELAALNAEASATTDEMQKQTVQLNIDNVTQTLARLRARQQAWSDQLASL